MSLPNLPQMDPECLSWLWFSCLPTLRVLARQMLLQKAGSPRLLMNLDRKGLQALGIQDTQALELLLSPVYREKARILAESSFQAGMGILYPTHPDYPPLLLQVADRPSVLYWQGACLPWKKRASPCVAVVGSRRATGYGITMASRLSQELASRGHPIISGLARGIDTAAHTGALQAGGGTIAVLGGGLGKDLTCVYPPENRKLAQRILETGCLLTEYEPGLPPAAFHFPMRNRIISGISKGVIVVEAGMKSGSLITVGTALEQNRDVMVVPGNATSVCSQGGNQLIREGATLVQTVEDALDVLNGIQPRKENGMMEEALATARAMASRALGLTKLCDPASPDAGKRTRRRHAARIEERDDSLPVLSIAERIVYERLKREMLSPDDLIAQSGLTFPELQQVLLQLELKGLAAQALDGRVSLL